MAGFLYYLPGQSSPVSLQQVQQLGLGYAFDGKSPTTRECRSRTPDGGNGVTFADETRLGREVKMELDAQQWREIPNSPVWLGFYRDARPTPQDLIREELLDGVVLHIDGHPWQLPIVRTLDPNSGAAISTLPKTLDLDRHGKVVLGDVVPAWQHLWLATEPAWQAMIGEHELTEEQIIELVGVLFGANYVVSAVELFTLGMFTARRKPADFIAVALDWFTWKEWSERQKKTKSSPERDGCSTSDGAADSPLDTIRRAPTC